MTPLQGLTTMNRAMLALAVALSATFLPGVVEAVCEYCKYLKFALAQNEIMYNESFMKTC